MDEPKPLIICRTTMRGIQPAMGKSGRVRTLSMRQPTITPRAPKRSISAPPWMASRMGRMCLAPMMRPIVAADLPVPASQTGRMIDMTSVTVLANMPAPYTGA